MILNIGTADRSTMVSMEFGDALEVARIRTRRKVKVEKIRVVVFLAGMLAIEIAVKMIWN